jgi:hypothetical protein
MTLLVLLLVGEQVLAYFNSFHAHRGTQLVRLGRPGHRATIRQLREQNAADRESARARRDADRAADDPARAAAAPDTDLPVRGARP